MTYHVSRRNILRLGAAAAALPWLPSLASAAATALRDLLVSGAQSLVVRLNA
jgi:hypothetical protein